MRRQQWVKAMAHDATRPLADFIEPAAAEPAAAATQTGATTDLFVWFEDTRSRAAGGGPRGAAGLPESLLPWPLDATSTMTIVDRRYAEGHLHLLAAVRLRVKGAIGERFAALYTAALSVGSVAWIGSGPRYERMWRELYPDRPAP